MTSDLGVDDIVVNFDSPQSISQETVISSGQLEESETGAETGAARLTSSLGVELGRLLLAAARDGDCDLVLELMARGAPFTSDWLWTSPLHLAAANAHVDTCAVLLRAGVSRDARTKVDRTPLHFAAYGGHAAVAQLLLQHGAFVDCKDMLLMTPLHWACERGHVQCAAVLLQHGASCSFVSKFLQTPRGIAEARGHEEIVALIDEAVRQREESCEGKRVKFPTLSDFNVVEDLKENVTTQSKNDKQNLNESQNNSSAESATAAAALLRQHGITLLPADEGSTVLTALQSGRSVVLSDAGKLMLRESESPPKPITNNTPATTTTAASYNNMLLTATPVRSPPRAGVKIFTVTNKMADKVDLKKVMTTNDMQVKYVAMPGDARSLGTAKPPLRRNTLNVSTVKALQKDGLLKVSGAASNVGAMNILMNKRKLNKLIVDSTTTSTETATTTAISNNKIHKNAEVKEPTVMETESSDTTDNIVRVPEEFLRSSSPEYLRAQLLAAHAAIAKLRRELRQARQALADARGQ